MKRSEREVLAAAAAHCDDCVCWVQHCEAECCRVFTFYLAPDSDVGPVGDTIRIRLSLTDDQRRYYELHGAQVDREVVSVPRSACVFTPTRLTVNMTCRELRDDLRCAVHENGQPACCSGFTLATALAGDWVLTPRCLFAYKTQARAGGR